MRAFFRSLLVTGVILGPAAGIAHAVTVPQLVELMKAGLSDDVLIALIETDGSIFQLSATEILSLHRQGLSDKVIVTMVETAKKLKPPAREVPAREIVVPPAEESAPREVGPVPPVQVAATPPPTVNVNVKIEQPSAPNSYAYPNQYPYSYPYYYSSFLPVSVPLVTHPAVVAPATMPVYWGWNGQRRPDTWQPPRLVNPVPGVIDRPAGLGSRKGG